MVFKVRELFPSNTIHADGDDWWDLKRHVNKLVKENPGEKIVLDFERVFAQWGNSSVAANDILKNENVEMVFYNNPEIVDGLHVILAFYDRPLETVRNVTVNIDSGIKKPLTPKELRNKSIREHVELMCSRAIIMMGVLRVRIDSWKDAPFSNIGVAEQIDAIFGAIYDVAVKRIQDGDNLTTIIVHFGNHDVSTHLEKNIGEYYNKLMEIGVELSVQTLRYAMNERIKVRTQIGREWNNSQKLELIKKLGKGRVGILTRFKNHKSKNMELRMEGEITNQWIAIIRGWNKSKVRFDLIYYRDLDTRVDAWWNSPEEDYEPEFKTKDVKLEELGLERACIGLLWHFNRFDGSSDGVQYKDTLTRADLSWDEKNHKKERVSIPEYVRRALLTNGIPFNEENLKSDTMEFEMKLNEKKSNQ